jgi:ribose transport system ATP-binding protein
MLEARGISKAFLGARALYDVRFGIDAGEVVALIGENGAGKSTLMKILAGVHQPDSGSLRLDGNTIVLRGPEDAIRHGIVLIHQELNLAENLTIAENLVLGREPTWGGILGMVDRTATRLTAINALKRVGLAVDPNTRVGDLAPGQKQLVEIARALSLNARVLIMDEPTSSLSHQESERLTQVIGELRAKGVAIVYISHRLSEVSKVADRVISLRDGCNSGDLPREGITHDAMVKLMVGRDLVRLTRPTSKTGQVLLSVSGLRHQASPAGGISFAIRAGEVVGMAGLVGAGRTELAETLYGARPMVGGKVTIRDVPFQPGRPADAIKRGLLLVPEDRRHHGLILAESIRGNISLPNLEGISRAGWVSRQHENKMVRHGIAELGIRTTGPDKAAGQLSGGNQQKVVLARWLAANPTVLILDEPTRGVDVGAKSEIYDLIGKLVDQGLGVLMISSDLEEILRLSDRVLVLHEHGLAGELSRDELSEEAVMRLATGTAPRRTTP